jgi:hypothetical protein
MLLISLSINFVCEKIERGMAEVALPVGDTITFVNTSGSISIFECTQLPGPIDSFGLWNYIGSGTLPFTLPMLQLQMVFIFTLNQAAHYVLKPYGVPKFATQVLVRACFIPIPMHGV